MKNSIDEHMFEWYYNNNRDDSCGQNQLPVWNPSKQDLEFFVFW